MSTPALSEGQLAGQWEAVMPSPDSGMATGLYRLEMANSGDSYLISAYLLSDRSLYVRFIGRVIAHEVKDGRVKLKLKNTGKLDPTREFVLEGPAWGLENTGVIEAKLLSSHSRFSPDYAVDLHFKKGSWTRDLDAVSKGAQKLIDKERAKPKA